MPRWAVMIKATVRKTIEVEADTEDEAIDEAHSLFSVLNDGEEEDYDEETEGVERIDEPTEPGDADPGEGNVEKVKPEQT